MHADRVRDAYDLLSARYVELLGRVELMHEADRRRIDAWAETQLTSARAGAAASEPPRFLDLGCGPGHWTDRLQRAGLDISGIDLSPEFIDSARREFPGVDYRVGDARHLTSRDGSLSGVLAWFSLIHTRPEELPAILEEIARVLAPGGGLLLGCFSGDELAPFDHAVTRAWFWPTSELATRLKDAGFSVLDIEERHEPGERAVASLSAMRRD